MSTPAFRNGQQAERPAEQASVLSASAATNVHMVLEEYDLPGDMNIKPEEAPAQHFSNRLEPDSSSQHLNLIIGKKRIRR